MRGLPDKIKTFFISRSSFEVLSFSGSSIAQVCISRNLHFVHLFELKGSNNPLDPLIVTLRVSFRSSASFVKIRGSKFHKLFSLFYLFIIFIADSLAPFGMGIFSWHFHRKMREPTIRGCSVPMLHACRDIDDITHRHLLR